MVNSLKNISVFAGLGVGSIAGFVRTAGGKVSEAFGRFSRDESGIALVEFAAVLPVMLTLGLYGSEVVRMSTTKMKVSQIALSLADNASRLGQTDNSGISPTINEAGVDAIIQGALRQGQGIDLEANGRVILSSLEVEASNSRQYIHWQRCRGLKDKDSAYGNDGADNGLTGTAMTGMGSHATQAVASANSAVMFVEVFYDYVPMLALPFSSGAASFSAEAAFIVRDDRNLSGGVTGTSTSIC